MGFILLLVSAGLSAILYPFAFIITLYNDFKKFRFNAGFKRLNEHFLYIATSIDANGNVVCEDLFDLVLIKSNSYQFGNRKETVSSVLGKNQRDKTLTWVGWGLANLLNLIQKNHCLISIDNDVE